MKIQELAIIFVIIILPISLLLSEYTQFQIQTLKTQTAYDAKLTAATYDAIKAFQLNEKNETYSDLGNAELRDLSASVNSFRNSLMSTFKLNGYTEEEINNYIPALVYTLYDGFYIYSPYNNTNHRYLDIATGEGITKTEPTGSDVVADGNGENLYGLKPYINYSCRYVYPKGAANPTIDVVITYALDNRITVQGLVGDEYVNKSGYLIDNIDSTVTPVTYNGVAIETEQLIEEIAGREYKYVKYNGTKYYLDEDNGKIITISNGTIHTHATLANNEEEYNEKRNLILYNNTAQQYYIKADAFTEWFKSTDLTKLTYEHAIDEVINKSDGTTSIANIWDGNTTKIFEFNPSDSDFNNNIENESSNFNQHRLAVIRHKIETNLAIAISNYNAYSGATNIFQMPELKEDEWDHITHNISLISFLQGLPIGGKLYNGYTLVTNSESEEVVLEGNIYILGKQDDGDGDDETFQWTYHRIGDKGLESGGTVTIDSDRYEGNGGEGKVISAGRLNLDFMRNSLISNDISTYYYYPLNQYNASYDSVVMQNNATTYDDIYAYVNNQSDDLKTAFYTALGRERMARYDNETKTYTIIYDGNGEGVTNLPATQIKEHGNPLVLSTQEPDRAGCTFVGWSIDKNDTVEYNPGDTYTNDASMILYAVWETSLYTVTWDTDGGIPVPESMVKTEGEVITLPSVTKTGHNFMGWSDGYTTRNSGVNYTVNGDVEFLAIWERETYTITYHATESGVSGVPGTQTKYYGDDDFKLTLDVPIRNHYVCIGWSTTSGGTIEYYPGDEYTGNADLDLYAVWTDELYTVEYNANGGSPEPDTKEVAYETIITLPSEDDVEKTGYALEGWSDGVTIYNPGTNYTVMGDVKFEAIWKAVYTVTYDPNGGSVSPTSEKVIAGESIVLPQPTRTGYNFKGWTAPDGSLLDVGASYTINEDGLTFVANWEVSGYTITYDANGGTFDTGDTTMEETVAYGEAITSEQPSQVGFKFKGWAKTSTATEIKYESGDRYYGNENTTLYAVWEYTETCTITYDKNGGVWTPNYSGPQQEVVVKGEKTKMSKHSLFYVTLAEGGSYKFIGWNTDKTAKVVEYSDGGYITINEDTTLYAMWKWVPDTYKVTYDANGGEGAPEQQTKTHGKSLTLSSEIPTRSGYDFLGWATTETATSAEYQPGGTYTTNEAVTLYAVWGYTVTYDADGGTVTPSSETVYPGGSVTLPTPELEGYTCTGWTTPDGDIVDAGTSYTINENGIIFKANWQKATYEITYNANGGTFTYGNTEQNANVSNGAKLTTAKPQREGHRFLGWADSPTATEVQYEPGDIYDRTENITLYAVWEEAVTYTITFDPNGGSWLAADEDKRKEPLSQIVVAGEKIRMVSEPFKMGSINLEFFVLDLDGWKNIETDQIYEPDKGYTDIVPTEDMEFIAIWSTP